MISFIVIQYCSMNHTITNALTLTGINSYYDIQNREFLIHLTLKYLFIFFIQSNIYWCNIQPRTTVACRHYVINIISCNLLARARSITVTGARVSLE
jgi:hypothetical protein